MLLNLYCWIFRVVPLSWVYGILGLQNIEFPKYCCTGIWNTEILEYSNTVFLPYWDTANLDLLNSIHIIAVYTIHWSYILCMFFHIHINYFTQLLYMYLLILHMHTFYWCFYLHSFTFTWIVNLYFYTYSKYYANSMFTYTLSSRNYCTHFLQCLRSIVTLQLCILYKHNQF